MRQYFVAGIILISLAASGSNAITFDAAAEFSHSNNPNGVWSYGWEDSSGFHLTTLNTQIAQDVFFWQGNLNGPLKEPSLGKNEGDAVLLINGSTTYAPDTFALHPGRLGQKAVLRWTAPYSGTFSIAARFEGLDHFTTTDVSVRENGTILDGDFITGLNTPFELLTTVTVTQNEITDFLVGFGQNNSFFYDSTRLDVLISDPPLTAFPNFPDIETTGLRVIPLNFGEAGPPPFIPGSSGGSAVPENTTSLAFALPAVGLLLLFKTGRSKIKNLRKSAKSSVK